MPRTKKTTKTPKQVLVHRAAEIVRQWVPRLGLTAWRLEVEAYDDDGGTAGAKVTMPANYRSATIYINMGMAEVDDAMFEHMLVHELTHIVCAPISGWIDRNLVVDGPLRTELEGYMETIVDHTANVFRALHSL